MPEAVPHTAARTDTSIFSNSVPQREHDGVECSQVSTVVQVVCTKHNTVKCQKLEPGVLKLVRGLYRQFGSGGVLNWFSGSAGVLASNGPCLVCKAAVGSGERCRAAQVGAGSLSGRGMCLGSSGSGNAGEGGGRWGKVYSPQRKVFPSGTRSQSPPRIRWDLQLSVRTSHHTHSYPSDCARASRGTPRAPEPQPPARGPARGAHAATAAPAKPVAAGARGQRRRSRRVWRRGRGRRDAPAAPPAGNRARSRGERQRGAARFHAGCRTCCR